MDDIKEMIEKVVKKIQKDEKFQEKFKKDPVKAVEDVLGVDLPEDKINKVIDGIKAKMTVDTAKGLMDKAKDLLGK